MKQDYKYPNIGKKSTTKEEKKLYRTLCVKPLKTSESQKKKEKHIEENYNVRAKSTSQSCQINVQFTFFNLYREHTLWVYLAGFFFKKRVPAKLQH